MNVIVATDRNWAIGRDNALLFALPGDMKHFRALTLGGTVLLGRRTLESFPGGLPLCGRRNVVISRDGGFAREGVEVVRGVQGALAAVEGEDPDKVWVVGGGSVYAALLPRCRRAYVTRVDAEAADADTFFPNLDKLPAWREVSRSEPLEENGVRFHFAEYENIEL